MQRQRRRGHQPLRLPAQRVEGAAEPDVRLEPRWHPTRGPLDVDRLGRTGGCGERPDRQGLDRPHRYSTDDAGASRAEGRLRDRWPRRDGVPQVERDPAVTQRQQDAGRGLSARYGSRSTRPSASSRWIRSARLNRGPREQHARRLDVCGHRERARVSPVPSATGLAAQIRLALWNAEFGNQKIDQKKAKDWINQGQGYLDQAAALCGTFSSSPANAKALDKVNHIVVIYEENHSVRQPVRRLGGRQRARQRRWPRTTTQVDEAGTPTRASSRTT